MHAALDPLSRGGTITRLMDSLGPGPVRRLSLLGQLRGLSETLKLIRDLLVGLGIRRSGIRASLELTCALTGGVNAHGRAGIEVQVVQRQATEHVVHDRLRHSDV